MRKCQEEMCTRKATKILHEGDIFFFLCDEHYVKVKEEIERMKERIESMTEEEMEARLEELSKKETLH